MKIQIDKNWNAPSEIISLHYGWCNRTGKVNVATCVLAFISTMYILPAPLQAVVTCQIAKSFLFYFILKHMLGCFWECRIVWHPPGWRTLKSQVRISNSLNNSKNGTIICNLDNCDRYIIKIRSRKNHFYSFLIVLATATTNKF